MNTRTLLLELFFFSLPFLAFGTYRVLVRDAETQGKKSWPISILFIIGLGFAAIFWVFIILQEDRSTNKCIEKARIENGVLIPASTYECEKDIDTIGAPRSTDPGGSSDEPSDGETPEADIPLRLR